MAHPHGVGRIWTGACSVNCVFLDQAMRFQLLRVGARLIFAETAAAKAKSPMGRPAEPVYRILPANLCIGTVSVTAPSQATNVTPTSQLVDSSGNVCGRPVIKVLRGGLNGLRKEAGQGCPVLRGPALF